ncbi:endonuclease/exonuclease/phosphatase family protein, partial [Trifolium pratense]
MEVVDARRGTWRLTGFYGYPGGSRRRDSWNFLRHLSHVSNIPWCIIGDFNDILSSDEKKGRVDRPNWLINGFRDAVLDSGLIDIHMEGYQFTWFKSLGTDRAVEEKLDRAMSSEEWCQSFPNARLECLTVTSSDHYPLWLVCDPVRIYPRSDRKFMFENAWLVDSEFDSIVRSCWQNTGVDGVVQKLDMCAATMSQWSKDNFQNLRREIDKCHKRLERARGQVDSSNVNYFNALKK